jgi:hypothetical protein
VIEAFKHSSDKFQKESFKRLQIVMTLKGHKNSIANGATATGSACWQPRGLVCFGLINPNTLATSGMLRRDQQVSSIERWFGDYLFKHQ